MRYAVDTQALRDSAGTVEEVLAQVSRLRIAEELRPLAAAVPGGRTAVGLHHVSTAWQARLARTSWELRELGRAVLAAADAYDDVERAVGAVGAVGVVVVQGSSPDRGRVGTDDPRSGGVRAVQPGGAR